MPTSAERCADCGFDATEWNEIDVGRTIGAATKLIDLWTEGMTPRARNARPRADTWSASEYVDHLRETFFGMRLLIEVATTDPGLDLGAMPEPAPPGERRSLNWETVQSDFAAEAALLSGAVDGLEREDWPAEVIIDGTAHDIHWAIRHAVHDLWHHLIDIAAGRVALGDRTPAQTGSVTQINVSDGGVPKLPIERTSVGRRGLVGDCQDARLHHGRPWQALCLWSAEAIAALQAEGHPIAPGLAGENLTIAGIDWPTMRAGTIVEIGDLRCQLSAAAVPCAKNSRWFADGDHNRILHDRHPGWSRWYASVLTGGAVAAGDPVRVIE